MPLRALAVWFLLLLAAIVNGGARESLLAPRLGSAWAHAISSVTLSALILLVTTATIRWIDPGTARAALAVGVAWMAMTVAFEFGFGHFARGMSLEAMLADYNVFRGRIWILVLLTTGAAPLLAARWRGLLPD